MAKCPCCGTEEVEGICPHTAEGEVATLHAKLQQADAALGWYADECHYKAEHEPECEDAAPDGPCIGAACTPICDTDVDGGDRARAALSDTGKGVIQQQVNQCILAEVIAEEREGWLEVREQAESLAEVFREDDRDEQDCRICGIVGHDHCVVPDFLAALDALEMK